MRERSNRPGRKYAAIPNEMLRDSSISSDARFLLALLMTYSDDWVFHKAHLMEITGFGRDKFERAMGDLRAAGYVEWVQNREESTGKLVGTTWVIRDHRGPENQGVGDTEALKNRHPVKPTPGKTAPKKTEREEDQSVGSLFGSIEPLKDACVKSEAETKKAEKIEVAFSEFWAAYPEKKDKDAARRGFQKAVKDGADPAKIVAGAKGYARWLASPPGPGEFRPHAKYPQGWLTNKRWLEFADAPPEPAQIYSRPIPRHETVIR